jgi:IclR family KDG regulon transcriptional repressor
MAVTDDAMSQETQEKYVNKSLQRALRVLDLFTSEDRGLTATEISKRVGTLPGTVFATLRTLERAGYLVRDENKRYALGLKLLERASLVLARMDVRATAQQTLKDVAREYKVNTHLAVLHEQSVMYLHREEGYPSVILKEVVGTRVPAYCTALGKILLSGLDEGSLDEYLESTELSPLTPFTITEPGMLRSEIRQIRQQGYGVDNEEFHEGSLCLAAPVKGYEGAVIAAVSLSLPKSLATGGQLSQYINVIREASGRISQELGYDPAVSTSMPRDLERASD